MGQEVCSGFAPRGLRCALAARASFHAGPLDHGPLVIVEDDNSSVGNIFCFAAFADKRTGVLYNDLTGLFPYMSLEGNVCYLIVYHYESNAILGLPISGFNDNTVFAAYKTQFEFLESKGYKIKLNVVTAAEARATAAAYAAVRSEATTAMMTTTMTMTATTTTTTTTATVIMTAAETLVEAVAMVTGEARAMVAAMAPANATTMAAMAAVAVVIQQRGR